VAAGPALSAVVVFMEGPNIVMLTEGEMERARRVADIRNSKNNCVPNYREDRKTSDWDMHFLGVRGEMAVCKLFNFPLDEHFSFGGDNGSPDLYICGDMVRVQVKTAKWEPPILKLNSVDEFLCDIAILCSLVDKNRRAQSVVGIWGYISRVAFQHRFKIHDFQYGPRATVTVEDLEPIGKLILDNQASLKVMCGGLKPQEVDAMRPASVKQSFLFGNNPAS
jgi:hypothetical protein